MSADIRQQAMALAAVVESARLVDRLARTGNAPAEEIGMLRESLFHFEWTRVEEVFGGIARLRAPLQLLETVLERYSHPAHGVLLRYGLAMLRLGRSLAHDRKRLSVIRTRLERIGPQSARITTTDDDLHARIAAIYQDTISTYRFRIQVAGSASHLQNERIAARIRTLLLAGLRAAVLWRHVGGSRGATLLGRRRLIAACRELRAS